MSTMGSKTPMHLSIEEEASLGTGSAQLLILIPNIYSIMKLGLNATNSSNIIINTFFLHLDSLT